MKKRNLLILAGFILFSIAASAFGQKTYTAYNLWYEKPELMYCINYQKGTFVQAGTEIENVVVKGNRISFTIIDNHVNCIIIFNPKYHGSDVTAETLKDRLATTKSFSQLTSGLKPFETEAIRQGLVVQGMSKKAVLISFGYPPEHKTPSQDASQWIYWKDRFRMLYVNFDSDGKVANDVK